MIIYPNPRRTRILLRVRRIAEARLAKSKPDWPDEARAQQVNEDMKTISAMPMRKVRLVLSVLENEFASRT